MDSGHIDKSHQRSYGTGGIDLDFESNNPILQKIPNSPLHEIIDAAKIKEKNELNSLGTLPELSLDEHKWHKTSLGIGYMLAMGVCGVVLVALGSSLEDLAENIGLESTDIGTVFIARGVGAIFGAVISAKIYRWFPGNLVMTIALTLIIVLLLSLPFNKSYIILHVYFLFLGLGTAVTDTGCQIMTRKVHGKKAGPWLGANTVAFGISGALVPLIAIITGSLVLQYYILSALIAAITIFIFFGPNPDKLGMSGQPAGAPRNNEPRKKVPHYNVEIMLGCMVFCLIGGKVTSTAYLSTYVDDTGVIDTSNESGLVLVLWIAITIGRLAGVYDQRFLTNVTLPVHLSIFLIGGFLSMLLILWFPNNGPVLWIGVAFYGLFNGPCVGYCYDLNNRITLPSEKSMAIVMFGLNFGASLVPYLNSVIWTATGSPKTLIVTIFLSMFLPLPLLHMVKYVSYDETYNPLLRKEPKYDALPQNDA